MSVPGRARVDIHSAIRGVEHLARLLEAPESVPRFEQFWGGPRALDLGYVDGAFYWGISGQRGYQRGLTASEVAVVLAPILERPELAWTCTCGAEVGEPCAGRDESHRSRLAKFENYERRYAPQPEEGR